MARTKVPWSHRRQIGRFRAYWRTLWLAIFGIQKLAADMNRPVSYADAQRFRWVTIGLIFLHAVIGGGIWMARASDGEIRDLSVTGLGLPDSLVPWGVPLMALGFLLFLIAMTGIPSYFFHPKRLPIVQQNKAIALSYYTSAVLLPTAWSIYFWAAGEVASLYLPDGFVDRHWTPVVIVILTLIISAILFSIAFFWNTSALLRETTGCGILRRLLTAAIQVISIAVLGPALLLGLTWLVGFIFLVFRG